MAILQTCCFFQSVRQGSYASVIYTLIYSIVSCTTISLFLYNERGYLSGEEEKPQEISFLENSPTTLFLNILSLSCAVLGILSSILVIIGLRKNRREMLMPWICVMTFDILCEIVNYVYLVMNPELPFDPVTAVIFTASFFIMCLNVYCLLCVISQYQEFKAGRGRQDSLLYANNVRFVTTPQVYFNTSQQSKLSPSLMCGNYTNCTLLAEDIQPNGYNVVHSSTLQPNNDKILIKKQVKFVDDTKCCSKEVITNGKCFNSLPIPEYNEDILSWNEQNLDQCQQDE